MQMVCKDGFPNFDDAKRSLEQVLTQVQDYLPFYLYFGALADQ
jgi:hypothetical protein